MRVITGKYKGRHFEVPRSFKARPTTDFAKENLFNVLNGYLDFDDQPTALDLFAGTGSITLELLSRGCSKVVSIEKDFKHYSFISQVLEKLKEEHCVAIRGDVFKFIKQSKEKFDIIFADPPYVLKEIEILPQLIFEYNILKPNGLLILEHGKDNRFTSHPLFIEQRSYGSVNFSFFRAAALTSE